MKKTLPIVFISFLLIFAILTCVLSKPARSENERRLLADFPVLTFESLKSGTFTSELDTYLADRFALRDTWVGIYSYFSLAIGQNGKSGIYKGKDGYLIEVPSSYDELQLKRNIDSIRKFSEKTSLTPYVLAVPAKAYVLESKLPKNRISSNDTEIFAYLEACGIHMIDIRNSFLTSTEQVFYKTDHHTTAYGSYLMYNAVCDSYGLDKKEFSMKESYGDFYGTSYSKSGLWLTKPDTVEIYKTDYPSTVTVEIDGTQADGLYFYEKLSTQDKYEVFLDGNHAITKIKNADVANGKRLLIVKDSYAHCVTAMLSESFEEIVMVDLRYYRKSVTKLIEEESINGLLFIYGCENLASSTDIAWLKL